MSRYSEIRVRNSGFLNDREIVSKAIAQHFSGFYKRRNARYLFLYGMYMQRLTLDASFREIFAIFQRKRVERISFVEISVKPYPPTCGT